MISFYIRCDPPRSTAQQQKTTCVGGKPRKYDPPQLRAAKQSILAMVTPYAPDEPLTGPLKITIKWCYPLRKSEPKKRRELAEFKDLPCNTRPDVDNLQKGFFDQMTKAGFWQDDSQLAHVDFYKCWGSKPGITVKIERAK